jgi:D-alanyl-D-alanine carboxypeptidase/D-alanyl-D-alanine-endopeptidase (penicillin-binding protein 4)
MARRLAAVALACFASAALADALPSPVAQALARTGLPTAAVALYVQEVDAARPSAIFNAAQAMNPASTIKLVTAFAALELLGPAYTWKTEAYLAGPLRDDVLEGDLVLRGGGDPQLTIENFWLFLRSLRGRGLREIRGDLVLDRSYFAPGGHDPAGFDNERFRPYNVGADALLVNYKAVRFFFLPDAGGRGVAVVPEPKLAPLEVRSSVRLADGPCGDWRAGLRYDLQPSGGGVRASFSGTLPASCGERVWNLAPFPPDQYLHGVFKALWTELGGTLHGGVREGRAPAGAGPFATFDSPPAADVLRDMNKFSNNVMARQVFLTLAAEALGPPGRYENGARAVAAWLAARRLEVPELVIENGSGLSRRDRISAAGLGRLLVAAYRSPVMPEFIATLPLVAYDGTMKQRLKADRVSGQAHVKTGSLADVRSLAGYVLDRNGRRFAVVFFVNHPNAGAAQAAQDALLRWVHDAAR